jgi:hypothetical protein
MENKIWSIKFDTNMPNPPARGPYSTKQRAENGLILWRMSTKIWNEDPFALEEKYNVRIESHRSSTDRAGLL